MSTASGAGHGSTGSLSGYWDSLVRTGFRDALRIAVLEGQKMAFGHRPSRETKGEREAFLRLSATAPDHVTHSVNVAALSLRLFDELAPLHGLGRRDRELLSFAAIVHDIGWMAGQAGHQKKSAELILMSGDLPVPVREQGIISLVAGLHGGSARARPPVSGSSSHHLTKNASEALLHLSGSLTALIISIQET